jgi:hypothetical protein
VQKKNDIEQDIRRSDSESSGDEHHKTQPKEVVVVSGVGESHKKQPGTSEAKGKRTETVVLTVSISIRIQTNRW